MGKQSRRKRDRRNQPPPAPTPRLRFQMAMIEGELEEIARHGRPCILCGALCHDAGAWFPTDALSRYLGAGPGQTRVVTYALCCDCHALPGAGDRVERTILDEHRTRLAATEAGLDVSDRILAFAGPDDAARFGAAWERHAPPESGGNT